MQAARLSKMKDTKLSSHTGFTKYYLRFRFFSHVSMFRICCHHPQFLIWVFRDDDDINDVASMAGVNLSEESANILATNSGLVGAVTHSCKDEAFLSCSLLQRRMLEIGEMLKRLLRMQHPTSHLLKTHGYHNISVPGRRFGVTDLGAEVVTFVSHAAQQRLQSLLEKVSHVAQQKNINFKVCLQRSYRRIVF